MKSLVAAVIVAVLLAACNTDSLPPAAGFTTVSGTILDGATKNPVAGAVVTIDTVLTATTDASGKFSVDKVPSGIVDFTVQAKGYKLLSSTATVEPGKPYELDLTLAAPSAP
jgi:Carboxypeptidase regulatory-like domain